MKKHAKQVAAWGQLSGLCHTLGDSYKPSKDSMKSTALENLLRESQQSVSAVHNAETFLAETITARKEIFDRLPDIGTRVIGALEATGASPERIKDVNAYRKRFRYQAFPKGDIAQNDDPGGQAPISSGQAPISSGQAGQITEDSSSTVKRRIPYGDFESKIGNFELMISQLEQSTSYAPSEDELSIAGLKQFLVTMKTTHGRVAQAQLELYQAKKKRDALMFGTNGMHGQARLVKKYVRSLYGFKSKEFKTINKIKFAK
jgi:hypothetical protein